MQSAAPRLASALPRLALALLGLGALAGVIVPRVEARRAHARDLERVRTMERVRTVLERYRRVHGDYPPSRCEWSTSLDADFLGALVEQGLLDSAPRDPRNEPAFHYAYARYEAGAHGCVGSGPYFVLAVTAFEDERFAARHTGWFKCMARSWNSEFAYVTGGGAALE
ncbi:MAG: hypothetical protein FJ294_06050 [Planctomycetes bacterium]|nr:hypothetical protein [Planctomycetota bacterium]